MAKLWKFSLPVVQETGDVSHFAHGLNFYKLFWVFFIGCFLGVVLETFWVLITRFELMNRTGLVLGPFNLVYGFGAVLMTLCLYPLRAQRDLWIFLGGAALGGAYEYLCSWLQETLFGTVSWDYSTMPYNLSGRINLLYCLFWGFLGLLWLKDLYPRISNWIEAHVPKVMGVTLTWVLVVFMLFNTVLSGLAVYRMSERYQNIPPRTAVGRFLDKHYSDEKLAKIYPSMVRTQK